MLEQWHADMLLDADKLYSDSTVIDLSPGVDHNYTIESVDGDMFIFDVRRGQRNPQKARFQLRYRRDIVLARLCTSVPHTNPDGQVLDAPHLHRYREEYGDRFARQLESATLEDLLLIFCDSIKLARPDIQGGML